MLKWGAEAEGGPGSDDWLAYGRPCGDVSAWQEEGPGGSGSGGWDRVNGEELDGVRSGDEPKPIPIL